MKTFKIEHRGELPTYVKAIVEKFNGVKADKASVAYLDDEIKFCVCDLGEAHGNLNKFSKDAWLCPKGGDDSFNVRITF